jgi:hypothetical protein
MTTEAISLTCNITADVYTLVVSEVGLRGLPGEPGVDGIPGPRFAVLGKLAWAAIEALVEPVAGDAYLLTALDAQAPERPDGDPAAIGDALQWSGTDWLNLGGPIEGPAGPNAISSSTTVTALTGVLRVADGVVAGSAGATDVGAEPALGTPGVTGYVLSSTTLGVRSWVAQTGGVALGETETTAYFGDRGKSAYDHSLTAHAPANATPAGVDGDTFATAHLSAFTHSNIAHGETAYGWGDHASGGYAAASALHAAITIDTNADTLLSLTGQALGLDTQAAATVLAGPTTGTAAVPTMRALVTTDIPALAYDAAGAAAAVTVTTLGAVPITRTINGQPLSADVTIDGQAGLASVRLFCDDVIFAGTTPVWHELERQSDGGTVGSHTVTTGNNTSVEMDRYVTAPLGTTVVPAGNWQFLLYAKTDAANRLQQIRCQIYRVNSVGTIVGSVLGTAETLTISATTTAGYSAAVYIAEQTGWDPTDRVGVVVSGRRTNNNGTLTWYHDHSQGWASSMATPLALLHNQMGGLNDGDYRHLTAAQLTSTAAIIAGTADLAAKSFSLSGNISAAAWTTSGIRYKNVAATLTDTTSSGTVATGYSDVFGANTVAASSTTTFTSYATVYIGDPVAGTNVTLTNKYSLDLQGGLKAGGKVSLNGGYDQAGITNDAESGGTLTIPLDGKIHSYTLPSNTNTTTIAFTAPTAPVCGATTLNLTQAASGGPHVIAWTTGYHWQDATRAVMPIAASARMKVYAEAGPTGIIDVSSALFGAP